jgi:hypothetical protein
MMNRATVQIAIGLLVVLTAAGAQAANAGAPDPHETARASAESGDDYRSPAYNHCVRSFFDPNMYGWYSFENTCGEALSITFIPYNPGFGGGAVDYLGPGRSTSTGNSREEIQRKQGYELYVCPTGFLPVDGNDRYVSRVNTMFRCKRR